MKNIFVIPGFKEKTTDKQYKSLKKIFEKKGFKVHLVPIVWKYTTLLNQVEQFISFYKKHKGLENYVLGFSFGAMIAFSSTTQIKPNKLFLCSLSPYFKEDLKGMNPRWKEFIGKRRQKDFSLISFIQIARGLKIKTYIFLGEEEAKKFPTLEKRCKEAQEKIKNSKLVRIEGAPYDIGNEQYQKALDSKIN